MLKDANVSELIEIIGKKKCFVRNFEKKFLFLQRQDKKTWSLFGIIVGLTNKGEQTSIQGFFDTTFLSHLISVAASADGVSACQETLKATICFQ